MDWSLLFSSYGDVFGSLQVILMTFIGAAGGVLLGAIPGMTATMGVALLIPWACCWASTAAACTAAPFPPF